MKKMSQLVLAAFFGFSFGNMSFADCRPPGPLETIFEKSTQVVLARTIKFEEGTSSDEEEEFIATVEVLKEYKGTGNSEVKVNCNYNKRRASYIYCPSKVGTAYILFLNGSSASACEPNTQIPVRDRLTKERFQKEGIPKDFDKATWPNEAAGVDQVLRMDAVLDLLSK